MYNILSLENTTTKKLARTNREDPMWITRKIDWQKEADSSRKRRNMKNHSGRSSIVLF